MKTWTVFLALALSMIAPPAYSQTLGDEDATTLALKGHDLKDDEASKMEKQLLTDPGNMTLRTELLGFYFGQSSETAKENHVRHVIWVIKNHPESEIAGTPYCSLDPISYVNGYFDTKTLWIKQTQEHGDNVSILRNAAQFLLLYDPDIAESLLKKAQSLDPGRVELYRDLGQLFNLNMSRRSGKARDELARKALGQFELANSIGTKGKDNEFVELDRFDQLPDLARAAFEAGEYEKANDYAKELLKMAQKEDLKSGNGGAIHYGNLILGRLALKSGDVESAKKYLIESGKTSGSPPLDSFGPNMTLAKELLEHGQREVVLEYFQLCSHFWQDSEKRLDEWAAVVKKGEIPDFGANLNY